jgi:hypothetical protein
VGDAELMLSDTTELAARALEAGAPDVEARVYVIHFWLFLCTTDQFGEGGGSLDS